MTEDLERTLGELGPECRAAVGRLVAGAQVEPTPGRLAKFFPPRRRALPRQPLLAAASVLVLLGIGSVFLRSEDRAAAPNSGAAHEYRLAEMQGDGAVEEMIRTQNADGSWQNDFLTRRNAAALARSSGAEARTAYKKAMRNLRVRGLL